MTIKQIVKKYKKQIKQMLESSNALNIHCPKCGQGGFEHDRGYWQCLWRDCLYRADELPSRSFFEDVIEMKEKHKWLKELTKEKLI